MMTVDPQHDALIVVDVQVDFLPGGALAVPKGDEVIAPIAALMPRFETVVLTQDWHPPEHISFASTHGKAPFTTIQLPDALGRFVREQTLWPDHCCQGTHGAEIPARLLLDPHVTSLMRKGTRKNADSYSGFRENLDEQGYRRPTGLGGWLAQRGINRVFVVGLARDYCVAWTAIDARDEGFRAVVIDSCTRPVFPDKAAETDAKFASAGVTVIPFL